jgi:hypothetical protein
MRVTHDAEARYNELREFCDLVKLDRENNDELAEYERTKDLASNPSSSSYLTANKTLAEITGGGDYDDY